MQFQAFACATGAFLAGLCLIRVSVDPWTDSVQSMNVTMKFKEEFLPAIRIHQKKSLDVNHLICVDRFLPRAKPPAKPLGSLYTVPLTRVFLQVSA